MGLFLPESPIPGTEEIIACVERKILFPNVPSLSPGPRASPRPPGSAGPTRGTGVRSRLVSAGTRALRKELACDLSVPWLPPEEAPPWAQAGQEHVLGPQRR